MPKPKVTMELWFKITALGSASVAAVLLGWPHQSFVLQASAILAAMHIFLYLLDKRGLLNTFMRHAISIIDYAFLVFALGESELLKQFGLYACGIFIVLKIRHRLNLMTLSPLVTAVLFIGLRFYGPVGNRALITQCGATFIGLLLIEIVGNTILSMAKTELSQEQSDEIAPDLSPVHPTQFAAVYQSKLSEIEPATTSPNAPDSWLEGLADLLPKVTAFPEPELIELRENFRRTKQYCEDLEEKSKKDRIAAVLVQSLTQNQESGFTNFVGLLREILGVKGVTLYRYQRQNDTLIVAASTLESGDTTRSHRLNIGQVKSDVRLRALATNALRSPNSNSHSCPVLLKTTGELTGMLWLSGETNFQLDNARDIAEESAELLGYWVNHIAEVEHLRKESARHHFLESLRRVLVGAESTTSLFSRFVSELFPTLKVDHLAITLIDDDAFLPIATEGASMKVYEDLKINGQVGYQALKATRFQPIFGLHPRRRR